MINGFTGKAKELPLTVKSNSSNNSLKKGVSGYAQKIIGGADCTWSCFVGRVMRIGRQSGGKGRKRKQSAQYGRKC
jgi:hypothetical protein